MDNEQYISTPPWLRPDVSGVRNFGGGQIVGRTLPHQNYDPRDLSYKLLESPSTYFYDLWDNATLSDSAITKVIRYRQIGFDVSVKGRLTFNIISNATLTGFLKLMFKLPIKPNPIYASATNIDPMPIGLCNAYDLSVTTSYPGFVFMQNFDTSTTTLTPKKGLKEPSCYFTAQATDGTRATQVNYVNDGGILGFEPFTWAVGDSIYFDINYEAAEQRGVL